MLSPLRLIVPALNAAEVSGMTDTSEPAWTEGIVGDIWDQMLTLCHPQDAQFERIFASDQSDN